MSAHNNTAPKKNYRSTSKHMALEQRLLFDGAGMVAAVDGFADTIEQEVAPSTHDQPVEQENIPFSAESRELVIIDSRVEGYQELIPAIGGDAIIYVVDSDESGLALISNALAGTGEPFDAIHIISHGTPGSFALGSDQVNSDTLAQQAALFASWADYLTDDADILLYGCDIAQGEAGDAFIYQLAAITGADIAASTNATGNESAGGDWVLESSTGSIEANNLELFGLMGVLDGNDGPRVESIVRQNPTPETTNQTTVTYLVTFSEKVNGVTGDSFVIAPGSIPGATIQLVTEVGNSGGTQYQVTISGLPNDALGNLNIDLADNNGITNDNAQPLTNLTPDRDDSYIIDTQITPAEVGQIDVGTVDNVTQTIYTNKTTGFVLTGTADSKDTVRIYIANNLVGTVEADNDGNWSYTYTGAGLEVKNGHSLVVRNSDLAGNQKTVLYSLNIDQIPPTVVEGNDSKVDDIIVEIKLDESLKSSGNLNPAQFSITVDGNAGPTVVKAELDGNTIRLRLDEAVSAGAVVTVSYASSGTVTDVAGNELASFADKALDNITRADNQAPSISLKDGEGGDDKATFFNIDGNEVHVFNQAPKYFDNPENDGDGNPKGFGVILKDTDDTHLEKAVIQITDNRHSGDVLRVVGDLPAGIEVEYDSSTGTLTLTGHATVEDYQQALTQIYFSATGNADNHRTITLTVNDGQVDSTSVTHTLRVLAKAFSLADTTEAYLLNASGGYLYGVDLVMGTIRDITTYNGLGAANALAFSPVDGHLYASKNNGSSYSLVRLNADGSVTTMITYNGSTNGPAPASTANLISADIDADGIMYLNSSSGTRIYRFDTNPTSDTYGTWLTALTLSGSRTSTDWVDMAVNPKDGMIYAAANNLYRINPDTGSVENLGAISGKSGSSFPMQYFDKDGFFYFTAGGNSPKINRLDISNPASPSTSATYQTYTGTLPTTGDAGRIVTIDLDYGDAPDSYNTKFDSSGAAHSQLDNQVWLGERVSAEYAASPEKDATGFDGNTDTADNGVVLDAEGKWPELRVGANTYSVDVVVNNPTDKDAKLIGWIDFNKDGKFSVDEAVVAIIAPNTSNGTVTLTWNVPGGITTGDTYARFRITSKTDSYTNDDWEKATVNNVDGRDPRSYGPRLDGEVEDYKITILEQDTTQPDVTHVTVNEGGTGPRYQPVEWVTVTFNEAVKDVDLADFELYRKNAAGVWVAVSFYDLDDDGTPTPRAEVRPVTGEGGKKWEIDLSKVTNPTGEYKLDIPGDTPGIKDLSDNNLNQGGSITFKIDNTAPVIDLDTSADTGADTRHWNVTTDNLTVPISLDNNAGEATVVELGVGDNGSRLVNVQITVGGLRDGDDEVINFGGTQVKANGTDGPWTNVDVGGVTVDITYSGGVFTIVGAGGGELSQTQASNIIRDLSYQNLLGANASNGERTFSFTAKDVAGSVATPAITTIKLEGGDGVNGPQTPTVEKVEDKERGTPTNNPTPTITGGAVVPNNGTITVVVDGKTYVWTDGGNNGDPENPSYDASTDTWTGPLQYDETTYTWTLKIPEANHLLDDTYEVEVSVTDSSSNTTTDLTSNELIIDTLEPNAPVINASSLTTHDTTPLITGTAELLNGEVLTIRINGKDYTEGDGHLVRNNNQWSLQIPDADKLAANDDAAYEVTTKVTDAAGNETITTEALWIKTVVVTSPTVNEASEYAVFTVTVLPNTNVSLVLQEDTATGGGVDYGTANGSGLEYFDGTNWVVYTTGNAVPADANGTLLVRTPITNDDINEGDETFKLIATPVYAGNESITDNTGTGTATIKDDGTGVIQDPNTGNPLNPGDNNYPETGLDDDRVVNITPPADDDIVPGDDPENPTTTPPYDADNPNPQDPRNPSYEYPEDTDENDKYNETTDIIVNEGNDAVIKVTITEGERPQEVTFKITDGSAKNGEEEDYLQEPIFYIDGEPVDESQVTDNGDGTWTVEVPAGKTEIFVRIPTNEDDKTEDTETFTLTVTTDDGTETTTTVYILDNLPPVPADPNTPANPQYPNQSFDPEDGYTLTVDEDTPTTGKILGKDPEGRPVEYIVTKEPEHGTLELDETTGEYTYTPDPDYNGPDEFEVTIKDGRQGGDTPVAIIIDFVAKQDAFDDIATVEYAEKVTIDVLANDTFDGDNPIITHVDGTPINEGETVKVQGGQVTLVNNKLLYTAESGNEGPQTFTYTAKTDTGTAETAKVTVIINGMPFVQPPAAPVPPMHNDSSNLDADDLLLGDQVRDPSVFFDGSLVNSVPRMDVPMHPVLYVDRQVSESQAERAQDDSRGFADPASVRPGNTMPMSIGGGLGQDHNLFVSHAIQESQQEADYFSASVEGRYGRLDLSSDGLLPGVRLFNEDPQDVLERTKDKKKKGTPAQATERTAPAQQAATDAEVQADANELAFLQPKEETTVTKQAALSFDEQLKQGAHLLPLMRQSA